MSNKFFVPKNAAIYLDNQVLFKVPRDGQDQREVTVMN